MYIRYIGQSLALVVSDCCCCSCGSAAVTDGNPGAALPPHHVCFTLTALEHTQLFSISGVHHQVPSAEDPPLSLLGSFLLIFQLPVKHHFLQETF